MSNPMFQFSDSSSSLLSDTPDIKKWFSSYTYQSPELDTNEHFFCFSAAVVNDDDKGLSVHDNECEKEENCEGFAAINQSVICKSAEEVQNQKHDSPSPTDVEVPDYTNSLSLPSEPPDITKWFPEYVYESPELDSADSDICLSSGYTSTVDRHLKELPATKSKNVTLNCADETATLGQVKNNVKSSTVYEDDSERSTLPPENILFPGTTFYQKTSTTEPNICNDIPDEPDVCARIRAEDLLPTVQEEDIDLTMKPAKKLRPAENDQCWISLDRKQKKEDYCSSIKKEQGQHIPVQNQSISIKNKARPMINKENSPAKSVCSFDEQQGLMLGRREVLKERTNVDSQLPEVAGKWRCPQKNKPYTGPPLKQLRLERWVRKR